MDIKKVAIKVKKKYKDYGVKAVIREAIKYVGLKKNNNKATRTSEPQAFKDILFVSGCNLPHPERYRVDHQIEQFEAFGLSCDKIFYMDLTLDKIKFYRGFVFYRCPILPTIKDFIKMAHEYNKTVFYDIDDLVFDTKYTDKIPYVISLDNGERKLYDDGVKRMGETMKLCDFGIVSTDRLKKEMEKFLPEVFVNRNVASVEMLECSNKAVNEVKRDADRIIIGYFSGTITHNEDFEMIQPVIIELLKKYPNLYLKIVGLLDLPPEMEEVKDKIIVSSFVDWRKLPDLIRSVDINIAPLKGSVFNEAKSENKWTEASLVMVPTIASKVGAFSDMIEDGKTGILCNNTKTAWRNALDSLIKSKNLRESLGRSAYLKVKEKNITIKSGKYVVDFVKSKLKRNIFFVLPSTNVSGGVMVAMKHAELLKKDGWDVTILNAQVKEENFRIGGSEIMVVSAISHQFFVHIDVLVATMWLTLDFVLRYPLVNKRKYLVQGYETEFYKAGEPEKAMANATYNNVDGVGYLTISKWIEHWLTKDFLVKNIGYAPNGIELKDFKLKKRDMSGKIKILIEGSSAHQYKNVDESFRIVKKLNKDKFEVHYLSYDGGPKTWYRIDKMHYKVPFDEVHKIYEECDILLKSSILESFSYPPLEMMATGGYVVAVLNDGNKEYLEDKKNCLLYERGNIDDAIEKIDMIVNDDRIQESLYVGGRKTADEREWNKIKGKVLNLYR